MSNLDKKSSSCVDNINNNLVKRTSVVPSPFIVLLTKFFFCRSFFPSDYRELKEGPKIDEKIYRPISLLVVWRKILERVMYNRVHNLFENQQQFYEKSFGFRSKSTIDAFVELTERARLKSH